MSERDITVEGTFNDDGISVSAYRGMAVLDETWFTWSEADWRSSNSQTDFVLELDSSPIVDEDAYDEFMSVLDGVLDSIDRNGYREQVTRLDELRDEMEADDD